MALRSARVACPVSTTPCRFRGTWSTSSDMRTPGGTTAAIAAIRDALGGRRLVWFGIRGEDGRALLQLPEFQACFAITAPLRAASLDPASNVTFESIGGRRPDLDRYDIDL